MSQDWPEERAGDEAEEYIPPPPSRYRAEQPTRPLPAPGAQPPAAPRYPPVNVAARRPADRSPSARDNFPLAVTAVVLLLVVGLGLVFLGVNNGGASIAVAPSGSNGPIIATLNAAPAPSGPTAEPPPRMPLADFKKLYDNPATRPLIIDVRAADAYNQGHILGAINFPESDVDAAYTTLPKDKLIVAYCQ